MPLGAEVKWQSFMQESILCLIERCGGEMDNYLRSNYLDNETLKARYDHNCLPLWNKFISKRREVIFVSVRWKCEGTTIISCFLACPRVSHRSRGPRNAL